MVYRDKGIEELGKVGVRNTSGTTPTYLTFAGSDNTHTGSETAISNEYLRKSVTWSQTGINSKYLVQLASTEAIGSNITALGLVSEVSIGSGNTHSSNASFIGNKTSAFNVQVEGEVVVRRPTT